MPQVTATLNGGGPRERQAVENATKARNQDENPEYNFIGDANSVREVRYHVYIFNVSEVELKIERPWVSYNPGAMGRIIVIPACAKGERVSRPYRIADVVQVPLRNDVNRTVQLIGQKGEFLAQDAINPEDPTGNWRTVRPAGTGQSFNEGVNKYHWGLFWTRNETPTDEEVGMARKRLEENYNRLVAEARKLWALGEKGRQQIGNTHSRAASYFGLEFEWNVLYSTKKECPQCGTKSMPTAAVCSNKECDVVFDWDKALELGLRVTDQAIKAGVMAPEAAAPKSPRRKSA